MLVKKCTKEVTMFKDKWYIGSVDGRREYLYDFSWDCGWYWGGGYLGNEHCHHHVDSIDQGKNINMFDAFKKYYTNLVFTDNQLWRFCDLFIQFYAYRKAAECFHSGGHMTSQGRTDLEINKENEQMLNEHIKLVIIPEIQKLMNATKNN